MVLIPDFALAPQHSTNSSLNSAALKLKKKTYFCLKTHFSTKIFRFKILHFGRIFETWNSILVWQRMLIKHMTCPPVLVNLRVANCYIWQYVVSILPSNMKYCHLLFLPSRQNGRIFAVELISPVNFASEFLPSSSFSQWFLPVNFAIEIKKRESPYLRRAVGAHGSNRSLQSGNSGRYTPDSGSFWKFWPLSKHLILPSYIFLF